MKHLFTILTAVLLATTLQAQNLFNAATASVESWCMPGFQGTARTDVATYNNGTITVNVPGDCNQQWQCQVKLQTQGIVLNATKSYKFSCKMNTNKAVSNVTVKLFHEGEPVLSESNSHSLAVGDNTVENPVFRGGDVATGIIVFDFGFAQQGTTVTVSEITLQEEIVEGAGGSADDEGYVLMWNEDFTEDALDMNSWNIEVNGDGGGNNELQYYCQKGVSIEANPFDGKKCLVLTATKENYNGKGCTSGRVTTQGKVTYTYGKIEARIKFPKTANGLWPAFWQMGNDIGQVGWPKCGETDFIEMGHSNGFKNNTQERYFNGAMHLGSAWNTVWSDAQSNTWPYSLQDTFHIITVIWTPNSMTMYMDRESHPENGPYFQTPLEPNAEDVFYDRQVVFGKPNFLLLNLAVGGNFPGIFDVNKITALANGPQKMYIDWVRVYQKEGQTNLIGGSGSDEIEVADPNFVPRGEGFEQNVEAVKSEKQLHNGSLIIVRGDACYDVLGHRL